MVIHLLYYVLQQRVTHLFLNDSQSCTDDLLWEVTNKCIYRNVDLLYYDQPSLLQVSATYYGHLQGGVLEVYLLKYHDLLFIKANYNDNFL